MVDFGAQSVRFHYGSIPPASRTVQPVTQLNVGLSVGLVANLCPSWTFTNKNGYALLGTLISHLHFAIELALIWRKVPAGYCGKLVSKKRRSKAARAIFEPSG